MISRDSWRYRDDLVGFMAIPIRSYAIHGDSERLMDTSPISHMAKLATANRPTSPHRGSSPASHGGGLAHGAPPFYIAFNHGRARLNLAAPSSSSPRPDLVWGPCTRRRHSKERRTTGKQGSTSPRRCSHKNVEPRTNSLDLAAPSSSSPRPDLVWGALHTAPPFYRASDHGRARLDLATQMLKLACTRRRHSKERRTTGKQGSTSPRRAQTRHGPTPYGGPCTRRVHLVERRTTGERGSATPHEKTKLP
jgi:hypothetical protein